MRARRRSKEDAKSAINNYKNRVFIDTSTYELNVRHALKTSIQDIILNYNSNGKTPIIVEVGMGNGAFLNEYASRNKETLCFGIELKEERIQEGIESAIENNIINTYYLKISAKNLDEIFKTSQIDTVFINFPDPWPKKRHIKNRLIHPSFLEIYKKIIKKTGSIILKTDNPIVYQYACEVFPENGLQIISSTENLPSSGDNIETKYENRYRKLGKNIYKIVAKK